MIQDIITDYDETAKVWHILTRTHKGVISIVKELDAPTARQVYRSLRPGEHPKIRINVPNGDKPWISSRYQTNGGFVGSVDILGPEKWELDPWKGVEPKIIDVAREAALDAMMSGKPQNEMAFVDTTLPKEPISESVADEFKRWIKLWLKR